jgi:hypothetical protein
MMKVGPTSGELYLRALLYDGAVLSAMTTAPRPWSSAAVHALVVLGAYSLLFTWLFAQPILTHRYLSESDLFDYFLPIFLSPITTWSSYEFAGLPAFADPGDSVWYPPHFFFARLIGSWNGFVISAFVLAACFTYAYVYRVTRSRAAAAFAGLAYGMSEALVERVPHLGVLHCAAWLPLMLLALEHLDDARARLWIAIGGVAVACAFLAGHPQPFVYMMYLTLAYALVRGVTEKRARAYYMSVAAMYALGGLLASIKALPLVEASVYMARQLVNPQQFVSHSNTPAEMLSMLFPTVLHDGREAPTYVGLATLLFAFVGLSMWRGSWRIVFWMCAGLFALVMGLGDATPIPQVLYLVVPLYGKFRVVARHLLFAAFAASFLAGSAVAALERGAIATTRVRVAALVLVALVAAGALIQAAAPGAFQYEPRLDAPFHLPVWNTGVWVQIVLVLMTVGAALAVKPGRRFVAAIAAVMAILYVDDLYSYFYRDTTLRLIPITVPASAVRPGIYAERLRRDLEPLHQRAMAIGGTSRDPVVPPSFARVWKIPLAGGYGPLLLQRTADLGMMGHEGATRPAIVATNDLALDLMAVRYIQVLRDDLAEPGTFEANGVTWASNDLALSIGRADCGYAYERADSIPLPPDVNVVDVAVVSYLRCSEDVPQDTEVARLRITGPGGVAAEEVFRAGVDTAEAALAEPSVLARARHQVAPNRFEDPSSPQALRFMTRVKLGAAVRGGRLDFTAPATHGWFTVDRVTVVDDRGVAHPLSAPRLWLADAGRWREVAHFSTSRVTDRDADEPGPLEVPETVYENLRALPRAWMVPEVRTLDDRDALAAVRHAQLPDGTRWDPHVTAIAAGDAKSQQQSYPSGAASARITAVDDGRFVVDVSSERGGFLVLSETYYPGWRARIDGAPASVQRADFSLMSTSVPAGTHTVQFEFVSNVQRAGTVLSVAGLIVCAGLILRRVRRKTGAERAPVHVARSRQIP